MKTLRRVPDELRGMDYDVSVVDAYQQLADNRSLVVCGNRDFQEYGDSQLIEVIKGSYYDDELAYDYETLDELKKLTGKRWEKTTIQGYSPSDWQDVYFAVDEVPANALAGFDDFYMGKYSEYIITEDENGDDEETIYVPHRIEWNGKKAICEYLDLDPNDTKVLVDDGYEKKYKYKELD